MPEWPTICDNVFQNWIDWDYLGCYLCLLELSLVFCDAIFVWKMHFIGTNNLEQKLQKKS